jgi:peptidyl-prolyl cis-trans isomerase C
MNTSISLQRSFHFILTLLLLASLAVPADAQNRPAQKTNIDVRVKPDGEIPSPPPIESVLPHLKKQNTPKPTPEPKHTPEPELVDKYPPHMVIVAEVGDNSEYILTRLELDRMLNASIGEFDDESLRQREMHEAVRDNLMRERELERARIMRRWAIMKTIAMLARQEGLRVTDKEVSEYIEMLNKEFGDDAFDADRSPIIKMVGITREELRRDISDALLIEKYVAKRIQENFTEKKMENIYRRNRAAFKRPARVKAYQIYMKTSELMSRSEKKILRKDFEKIWKKARDIDSIEDFQKLARRYSEPPYNDSGGSMGWVQMGDPMNERIITQLFRLDPDEVSRIIETPIGWHILTISKYEPAKGGTFDDYARELVKQLLIHQFKEEVGYYLMKEKADFTVRMNTKGVRIVGKPYEDRSQTPPPDFKK